MEYKLLHKDARGEIFRLAEKADVLRITSNAGARRANHYHREFGHWCLVAVGSIEYGERPVGSNKRVKWTNYKEGQLFWTGPMIEHVMLFPDYAYNEFYCFSVGARDSAAYELDTVHLDFDLDKV